MNRFRRNFLIVLRASPWTVGTTIVMVLCYLVSAAQAGSFSNNTAGGSAFAQACELYGPATAELPFGPLRTIASAFMHRGPEHLFGNAALLFLMGIMLEHYLGTRLYALLWITCGLGASSAILNFNFGTTTVGASGAANGIMVLYALFYWVAYRKLASPLLLIGINVGYTFLTPGVSVAGHLGGLATGLILVLLAVALRKNLKLFQPAVIVVLLAVCAAIAYPLYEFSTSVDLVQ